MSWHNHFDCEIVILSNKKKFSWKKSLPVPTKIPMHNLFMHTHPSRPKNKTEKSALSMDHRKALWVYNQINHKVWDKAAKEFEKWFSQFSELENLEIEVHHAGTAVMIHYLQHTPSNRCFNIKVHQAPLAWLQKKFGLKHKKNISLAVIPDSDCPWCKTPVLIGKAQAA
jgi:hypothetical protein